MKRSGMIMALWLGFGMIHYVFVQNYFALFFLGISICILVYLAITIVVVKNQVTVRLEGPSQVLKNSEVAAHIYVRNDAPIALGHVACHVTYTHIGTKHTQTEKMVFAVGRHSETKVPVKLPANHCGQVQLELKHLVIYDALTVFSTTIRAPFQIIYNVLPVGFPVILHIPEQHRAPSFTSSVGGNIANGTEIMDVKPYVVGDNVKNIHWKLSSKLDELFLKQMESFAQERFLILFALQESKCAIEQYDGMLEALSAIAQALFRQGKTFDFVWAGKNEQGYTVQTEEMFFTCLTTCMYNKEEDLPSIQFLLQALQPNYTTVICLAASHVTITSIENVLLLQYGEQPKMSHPAIMFTHENMQHQLQEIFFI